MDIGSVTPFNPGMDPQSSKSTEKKLDKAGQKESAHFEQSRNVKINGYTKTGQTHETGSVEKKAVHLSVLKYEIKKNIWDQAYALLQSYAEGNDTLPAFQQGLEQMEEWSQNPEDPIGLNAYFSEHPEDLEKIGQGEIPDYFNIENTGQRILDIWIGSEPPDANVEEWVEEVKGLIGQAYGEISGMFSGLPQLVLDTQSYVNDRLDQYAASHQDSNKSEGNAPTSIIA